MYLVQTLFLHTSTACVTPLEPDGEPLHVNLLTGQSVLMQYTGIVDGHDKPIYEGDILESRFDYNEDDAAVLGYSYSYTRHKVVFALGGFGEFDVDESRDFLALSRYNELMYEGDKLSHKWTCGNIFQHPDWEKVTRDIAIRPDLVIPDEIDEPEPAEASV